MTFLCRGWVYQPTILIIRRAKAVKEKYFFFGRACTCCQSEVRKEKTVKVRSRNVAQGYPNVLYFCKECTPTVCDVLEKIKDREIYGAE